MDTKHLQQAERAFDKAFAEYEAFNKYGTYVAVPVVARYFFSAGMQVAERVLKDAVLDVIDDGCTCDTEKHPWEFYEQDESGDLEAFSEDMANQQRLRFCDAVIARVRAIVEF